MRRILSVFITVVIAMQMIPLAEAAPMPFPDLEWTWYRYREAIEYLKGKDIISGYPDGNFHPKDTINRAELLKLVFRGKTDVVPAARRCFSDVGPQEWYAPYVCAAKNRGIVSGYPNGTFKPGQPVNTAEALKIILSAYGRQISPASGEKWYQTYVDELDSKDLLPSSSYIPWDPLTRERAADLLWRILRYDEDHINPRLSPGCTKVEPAAPRTTVQVNGVDRHFLLTVPSGYVSHDPFPLTVAFHGRTNSNEQVRAYYGIDRAMRGSFIAYPAALKNGSSFSWADGGDKAGQIRDVKFFDAIVESIANDYCIDMDRITVVGHSLGAWMANTVACLRGGVVLASATVGGDSVNTTCSGPSSALISHNPKDTAASYPSTERARDLRAKTDQCSPQFVDRDGPDLLNCSEYTQCIDGIKVLWCPHTVDTDERGKYYPHTWPRGTGQVIADFFSSLQ